MIADNNDLRARCTYRLLSLRFLYLGLGLGIVSPQYCACFGVDITPFFIYHIITFLVPTTVCLSLSEREPLMLHRN